MAITWITPVDVTPSTTAQWVDIDVSSYIPSGATGVMLHLVSDVYTYAMGCRKNGSTDDRHTGMGADRHCWMAIGVDANRVFEAYIGNDTYQTIKVVGYFAAESSFKTNGIQYQPNSALVWEDFNISSDTGADTAVAAIWELDAPVDLYALGFRKNGSTDNRTNSILYHGCMGAIVGVDSSEICEAYVGDVTDIDIFLVGYIKEAVSMNANATDLSLSSTGSWLDLAALPSGATGGFIEVKCGSTAYGFGLRKNGSTENIYEKVYSHAWGMVQCDTSQLIEGYIANTAVDFFLVGYVPASGTETTARLAARSILEKAASARVATRMLFEKSQAARLALRAVMHIGSYARLATTAMLAKIDASRLALRASFEKTAQLRLALRTVLQITGLVRLAIRASLEKTAAGRLALRISFSISNTGRVATRTVLEHKLTSRMATAATLTSAAEALVRAAMRAVFEKTESARLAAMASLTKSSTARTAVRAVLHVEGSIRVAGRSILEKTVSSRVAARTAFLAAGAIRVASVSRLAMTSAARAAMRSAMVKTASARLAMKTVLLAIASLRLAMRATFAKSAGFRLGMRAYLINPDFDLGLGRTPVFMAAEHITAKPAHRASAFKPRAKKEIKPER